ncbi:MAG: hypothetical protein AB8B59_01575 [Maribacter sp.]
MNLELLRLLFDSGLLVLIWIVQLVIYPSFQFYRKEDLLKWHKKYTPGISMIVIPLMFGQLITSVLQFMEVRNAFTIGSIILIVMVWVITFSQFVPLHGKIAAGKANEIHLKQMLNRNWTRTFLWTIIFIWTFLQSL